jgi:hypothetical protein
MNKENLRDSDIIKCQCINNVAHRTGSDLLLQVIKIVLKDMEDAPKFQGAAEYRYTREFIVSWDVDRGESKFVRAK